MSSASMRQLALPLLRPVARRWGLALQAAYQGDQAAALAGSTAAQQRMMAQTPGHARPQPPSMHQARPPVAASYVQAPWQQAGADQHLRQQQPFQQAPPQPHLQQQQQQQQQQPYQPTEQQAQQGTWSDAPASQPSAQEHAQGPDVCEWEDHCINAVGVTGRVMGPPTFAEYPSGNCKATLHLMTLPKGPRKPWPIQVEAWNQVAQSICQHVQEGSVVCFNGHLAPAYRASSAYRVVVDEFWLVLVESIPPGTLDTVEQAIAELPELPKQQPTGGRRGVSSTVLPPALAYKRYTQDGATFSALAQEYGMAASTVHDKLMQAAKENWQLDWGRVCSDVGLSDGTGSGGIPLQRLAAAAEEAIAANPNARAASTGEPLLKVLRQHALDDPALGPLLAAQEQQPEGVSQTYMQLRTITTMRKLGVGIGAAPAAAQ